MGFAMTGKTELNVLVVDDQRIMQRHIVAHLQQLGFTNVAVAENGRAALERLEQERFDFVISDWMMPEMDGLELVTAMRAHPKHKTIPVIMASTWPGNDQQRIARDAGAADYLVKPFRADALRSAIEAIVL